jgi:hypothetical protein
MTRDQIITTVLSRLGRSENNDYLVGRAQDELALIQERLEGGAFLPWFLLSDPTVLAAGTSGATAIPADFLRQYEDYPIYRYDTTEELVYKEMYKDEYDILKTEFEGQGSAEPTKYAIVGPYIFWFVTPDTTYVMVWIYYQKQDVLSDTITTNGWTDNASDLLIAELGEVMAAMKKDEYWTRKFSSDKVEAYTRLRAFDEARKQANRDAYRGDSE